MINWILSWVEWAVNAPLTLLAFLIAGCLPTAYIVATSGKLRGTPELNKKYYAFARTDMHKWNLWRTFGFGILTLGPVRYLGAWTMVLLCTLCILPMIGHKQGTNVSAWRAWFAWIVIYFTTRVHGYCSGNLWIGYNYVRDKCYKKYLGPDWRPTFEGAGIQVSNHISWLDIMVLLHKQMPSFVSKVEVLSYPGVGKIAQAIQCMFLVRGDSAEKRKAAADAIVERQVKSEKGELPILHIFPEGCTTNGTNVIKFKRGAFASLRKVRPVCLSYKSSEWGISPASDMAGFLKHALSAF